MTLLEEECEGGSEVSRYLQVVRDLIVSTAGCPDMDKLKLVLPGGSAEPEPDSGQMVLPLAASITAMSPPAAQFSSAAKKEGECYAGMLWTKSVSGVMKVSDGSG